MSRLSGFSASAAFNPGNILDGDEAAISVTVPGAKAGDFSLAAFSTPQQNLQLTTDVTAANTVVCTLSNSTGSAVDLAAGTIRVKVIPFDII